MYNRELNSEQKEYINNTKPKVTELRRLVQSTILKSLKPHNSKPHIHISGISGIGKSLLIQDIASECGVTLKIISTDITLTEFRTKLAKYEYYRKPDETIYIFLDNCDNLFKYTPALAKMMDILDADKKALSVNTDLTNQIQMYRNSGTKTNLATAKILESFKPADGNGVVISTANMVFIMASNESVIAIKGNPESAINKKRAAVRDRIECREYNLSPLEEWSWIYHILIDSKKTRLSKEQRLEVLNFMFDHWEVLPSLSIRTFNVLADTVLTYEKDYVNRWRSDYNIK